MAEDEEEEGGELPLDEDTEEEDLIAQDALLTEQELKEGMAEADLITMGGKTKKTHRIKPRFDLSDSPEVGSFPAPLIERNPCTDESAIQKKKQTMASYRFDSPAEMSKDIFERITESMDCVDVLDADREPMTKGFHEALATLHAKPVTTKKPSEKAAHAKRVNILLGQGVFAKDIVNS